jgi:hypothetical protein
MFIKLVQSDKSDQMAKIDLVKLYVPRVCDVLLKSEDLTITVEALAVLDQLAKMIPALVLLKYAAAVLSACQQLISHRKRVVRKFARVVTNSWA